MYIDTHVHLNSEEFDNRIEQIINEAKNNNVKKFLIVGYDLESSKKALIITRKLDCCYAIIGFHPTEIKNYSDIEYNWLEENAKDERVVAIGEIGFDFHWDVTTKEEQMQAFIKQIEIAKKVGKPISIHSRDAIQITYDTLKMQNIAQIGGVMHSYSGSVEMAQEFIKMNFYLGISGPVTFQNGKTMKEVVKAIDLKYLLTETDAPYLTPHPYRGKENSPKYIPLIVQKISEIKEIPLKDVEKQIMINTKELFGI